MEFLKLNHDFGGFPQALFDVQYPTKCRQVSTILNLPPTILNWQIVCNLCEKVQPHGDLPVGNWQDVWALSFADDMLATYFPNVPGNLQWSNSALPANRKKVANGLG